MYKHYENNIESDPFATARDTPSPPPHWTKNSFVTFKKGMGFIKKKFSWVGLLQPKMPFSFENKKFLLMDVEGTYVNCIRVVYLTS